MKDISTSEINRIILEVDSLVATKNFSKVLGALCPLLDKRSPFTKLDKVGDILGTAGKGDLKKVYRLLDEIVAYNAMGSYPIAGRALAVLLDTDFETVLKKAKEYMIFGNEWYVCDIIGERTFGQGLVLHFDSMVPHMTKFLADKNKWVKRSAGVAIHLFSKRIRNDSEKTKLLLEIVEPHIEEKQIDIVKGIGWGLKTIGRYHPDLVVPFLKTQIKARKKISALMMSKAKTNLSPKRKAELEGYSRTL